MIIIDVNYLHDDNHRRTKFSCYLHDNDWLLVLHVGTTCVAQLNARNYSMAADMEVLEKKSLHSSDLVLPISRVRTIMKSSPDVENISQDALYVVTAATVGFLSHNNLSKTNISLHLVFLCYLSGLYLGALHQGSCSSSLFIKRFRHVSFGIW